MLPRKLFAPLVKRAQSGAEKTHFARTFVSKTTHRLTHFPADDFREF